MKKILAQTLFLLIIALAPSYGAIETGTAENPDQARFISREFGLCVIIPREWHKSEYNLLYKHILILNGKNNARIKISAVVNDEQEKQKWEQWQDWYTNNSGHVVTTILEKKDIDYDPEIKETLIVFESMKRKQKYLNRILLVRSEKALITIECSAPVNVFYQNAIIFNTAMSSLDLNYTETSTIK